MAHFTRSRAVREAEIFGEGDVEPDDVPPVVDSAELSARSSVTAARRPSSVTTELAGPESVPNPTHGWTQTMSISGYTCFVAAILPADTTSNVAK